MAVLDSDPYNDDGSNWFTNQNNFFRQIRNFVIDITAMPPGQGAGIHWQVAQATSLQNIHFKMVKGGEGNKQQGIFQDNGSGGFMTDLTFEGGNYGAFLGAQQWTIRNVTFKDANEGLYMNWNWGYTLQNLYFENCQVGLNMSNTPDNQTVGSVILMDSMMKNVQKGVVTAYSKTKNVPASGNTLIVDMVHFADTPIAIADVKGQTLLKGGDMVKSWIQGHAYTTGTTTAGNATQSTCAASAPSASSTNVQASVKGLDKPKALLAQDGRFFTRSKPQYESVPASSFISVKDAGAKADGKSDDTDAIQKVFDSAKEDQIVYFDHGNYIVTKTIKVPKKIKIVGEIWSVIMATGKAFSDVSKPIPLFQVGQKGDSGAVEMSELVITSKGPAPGAILVEWNLNADSQGSNGIWDVHFRIGGFAGTELQSDTCTKNPNVTTTAETIKKCTGIFLALHVKEGGSLYTENTWMWTSDHELDIKDHNQINIFSGRGILIESDQPNWLWGTSSEHFQLYNYQFSNAKNVFAGFIQTETPYMQPNPGVLGGGFKPDSKFNDPEFDDKDKTSMAWGLRVVESSEIYIYGAGLYSFFNNWELECNSKESCQSNMVDISCSEAVTIFGLSTKASTNMVHVDGKAVVPQKANRSNFCSTIAVFENA